MANKNIVKGNIGNALHSVAPDHIISTADEIFDENLQQYQEDINAARQQADQTLQGNITQENTRALAAETASAEFNSTTKRLIFKNAAGMVLYEMDATPFIVDGMVDNVEISNGNLVITFNTDAGKQDISIPLTAIFNPANYYNKTEIDARTAALSAQNGYYECNTAAGTADKAVTITGFVMPINGGSIKIKMANANTAASGVKLVINNDNVNAKPLYYNGSVVSVSNTWDAGEVIEVYYNPSVNNNSGAWMANNVNGVFDGVFDISAYNLTNGQPTKYADLAAALGTNGANVPDSYRRGGMTVKYVQSSDNKYVQYRCMAQTFTTDVTQWQGVDITPTPESRNLAESGGVYKLTYKELFDLSASFNPISEDTVSTRTDKAVASNVYLSANKTYYIKAKGTLSAFTTKEIVLYYRHEGTDVYVPLYTSDGQSLSDGIYLKYIPEYDGRLSVRSYTEGDSIYVAAVNVEDGIDEMLLAENYSEVGAITYNDNNAIQSYNVEWADGTSGIYTSTDWDEANNMYKGYTVTYGDSLILTQPAVTVVNGLITSVPQKTITIQS